MEKTITIFQKNIRKYFIVGLCTASLLFPNILFAANLKFTPASGTYKQDSKFSVSVFVSSPDQAINAASAVIKFPSDKLQVTSLSKTGSIVDFWAREPSFSNAIGEIKLEGIVLTPGFIGSSGKLLTINFKATNTGSGTFSMFSSSVLANDGIGTNILAGVSNAVFTITEPVKEEPEVIKVNDLIQIKEETTITKDEEVCGSDSIIRSSTHPGIIWKKENTAVFSWDINSKTLATKTSFDKSPTTEPDTVNKPPLSEKKYEDLTDGTWYFHLALETEDGWEKTEHFKIKIDQTPPNIEASEIKNSDPTNPKKNIKINATDNYSCVDKFELSINEEIVNYKILPDGNIETEAIKPGQHELVIKVYDRAGNTNEATLPIYVQAIEIPTVTDYPSHIEAGEVLEVQGETVFNTKIEAKITSKKNNLLIRKEIESIDGKFTLTQENIKNGTIFVSFRAIDARGAESMWTTPVEVKVGNESFISFYDKISSLDKEILIVFGLLFTLGSILLTRFLTIRKMRRNM